MRILGQSNWTDDPDNPDEQSRTTISIVATSREIPFIEAAVREYRDRTLFAEHVIRSYALQGQDDRLCYNPKHPKCLEHAWVAEDCKNQVHAKDPPMHAPRNPARHYDDDPSPFTEEGLIKT